LFGNPRKIAEALGLVKMSEKSHMEVSVSKERDASAAVAERGITGSVVKTFF